MTRPKRHHLLSSFYLRRFADQKSQITAYRALKWTPIPKMNITNICVESGFYDVEAEGSPSPIAEHAISEVETVAADILGRLDKTEALPQGPERADFALYMALQLTRSSPFRSNYEKIHDFGTKADMEIMLENLSDARMAEYIRAWNEQFPSRQMSDKGSTQDAIGSLRFMPPRNLVIQHMFEFAVEIAPYLMERSWIVLTTNRRSFITCDQPVVMWRNPDPLNHMTGIGPATADRIYFPLDSKKVLMLALDLESEDGFQDVPPMTVKSVNQLVASNAHDWILHDPRHSPLENIRLPRERPILRANNVPIEYGEQAWKALRRQIR